MRPQTVLQARQLSIGYPRRIVAQQLNLSLLAGELVCLLGPNGAGKTTLMRTLAGMLPPLGGHVTLLGDDVREIDPRELARRLSIVLTDRLDVGLLSGYALVALGRHPYTDWTGNLSQKDEDVVRWAVQAVGAAHLATRKIAELSDGERQKLMIARALAQEPVLMILDEPTAYLDLPRRVEVMQLLRRLAHDTGRAILLSTHDLDLALRHADRIWLMPQGKPPFIGAPEDLVLSGALEATFQSAGVQFDRRSGSFIAKQDNPTSIAVEGTGLKAIWTIRAVERAGYRVLDAAPLTVRIAADGWHLISEETTHAAVHTLYDLIALLQAHIADTSDQTP